MAGRGGAGAARAAPASTTRPATCAPAARGSRATSTRTTRTRSCSPTTSRRCGRTRRDARIGDGLFRRGGHPRHVPGRVLLAAPRPDARRHGRGRRSGGSSTSGPSRPRSSASGYRWVQVFENRGRGDGCAATRTRTARSGRATRCPVEARARAREQAAHLAADGPPAARSTTPRPERGGPRVVARRRRLARCSCRSGRPGRSRRCSCPLTPAARLADLDDAARDGLAAALRDAQPALRRAVPAAVPVLDGLAPGAVRRRHGEADAEARGSSTRTSTRRSCARPCASSWSATSCSSEPQRDLTPEEAAERLRDALG